MIRAVAVIAAILLLIGAGAASSLSGPGIVRLTAETVSFNKKLGYHKLQTSLLYNTRITPYAIGNSEVLCTFLGKGGPLSEGTSYCDAVYSLPHGRILASGLIKRRSYYVLAVVGGTGLYSNVGGEVIVSTFAYGPRQERILFSVEVIP
jgi:hypothetical protein